MAGDGPGKRAALLVAGLVLAGFAVGCSDDPAEDETPGSAGSSSAPSEPTSQPPGTTLGTPPTTTVESPSESPRGVPGENFGETLQFGNLDVQVTSYLASVRKGAAGIRIDVISVKECATRGATRVSHRTWQLIDAKGRTLGAAGARMVHGQPTEDPPQQLAAGACRSTSLAISLPKDSAVYGVRDGPDATWLLPHL